MYYLFMNCNQIRLFHALDLNSIEKEKKKSQKFQQDFFKQLSWWYASERGRE